MVGRVTDSNLASRDFVFVSASPVHPSYPGGFARRHYDFLHAASELGSVGLLYLAAGAPEIYRDFRPPPTLCATEVLQLSRDSRNLTLPGQSVAREMRWRQPSMVIPLTANVAHISLTASRSLVVLEEAWERALPRLSPKSAIERLRYKWLYAALERTGHPIVAITEREASFYRARVASRVETVRYGVDLEHFTPMPRHEPSIDVLILGAVNRPEQLVEELVGKLRSEPAGRDVACCIVGSGARPEIEALADSRTTVTGYVEDVTPFYARARVVAIPTFTGIGVKTTMLQAWASGRAVVTSPAVLAGALDGRDAAVVATDTGEMARAILRLLHDDPRRERMEKAGRAVVEKNYDARANTATFARLLTEVSAGSRCGGGKR